jgi:Methylamine utilisation protein MauE
MELIGVFFIAAGLLVLAGIAKAFRPGDTARALLELVPGRLTRHGSLRAARLVVRVGAIVEAALGACALLSPRPVTAGLVAGSYVLFAAVVLSARAHGSALSTCGCFGRPDTPATWLHVAINVLLAAAALTVALTASSGATTVGALSHQPWAGMPLLFVSAVGLYLSYLALSPLATLEGARRLVRPVSAGTTNP